MTWQTTKTAICVSLCHEVLPPAPAVHSTSPVLITGSVIPILLIMIPDVEEPMENPVIKGRIITPESRGEYPLTFWKKSGMK